MAVKDGLERAARGQLPDPNGPVFGAREYLVIQDADREDSASMSAEQAYALVAEASLPDCDFCGRGTRDDQLPSACVCHSVDCALVAAVCTDRVV